MTAGHRVLVVGPQLAGVDGVVAALGAALTECVVVGHGGLAARDPDAIVVVFSAVAPVTRTDWDLIDRVAASTQMLIGVVSKIDAHHGWRAVLEADRALVAGWNGRRRTMPWVGVAAAPDLGAPRIDELVALVRDHFADPDRDQRNELWRSEFRLMSTRTRGMGVQRRSGGVDAVALRSVLLRTRLRLAGLVRDRCAALRAEMREHASEVRIGGSDRFETVVRGAAARFLAELDDEITRAVEEATVGLAIERQAVSRVLESRRDIQPDLSRMASSSRRLESRLMAVLGIGFGLGITVASSRLVAGLAPGPSLLGLLVGLSLGLALVVWVVRMRSLLADRALLDRWVTEVAATLRWHGEAVVAERLLAAESAWIRARSGRTPARASTGAGSGREDVTDQYRW